MPWLLAALGAFLLGAMLPPLLARRPAAALRSGMLCAASGCAALIALASSALASPPTALSLGWTLPLGGVRLALDPLSAWFLLLLGVVGAATALYGLGSLASTARERPVVGQAALLPLELGTVALVLVAADTVLFLAAWEVMTCLAFLLILWESERPEVRRAALLYVVLNHLAAAALVAALLALAAGAGTTDVAGLARAARDGAVPGAAGITALLMLGFLTKSGVWPLHVWLPRAHPAAPSHISAFLSGLLLATGVYGLLRFLPLLGPPSAVTGAALAGLGACSMLVGAVSALAEDDLKRVLAYSSVENMGRVYLGIGIWLLARGLDLPHPGQWALAGALLHVANHALAKSALFLAAGTVRHSAHTASLDRLGALAGPLRDTSRAFALGASVLSALPPFAGFLGEWLLGLGALGLFLEGRGVVAAAGLGALGVLALGGGLSALLYVRAFAAAFLGRARSPEAEGAHPAPALERLVPLALGGLGLATALAGPRLVAHVRWLAGSVGTELPAAVARGDAVDLAARTCSGLALALLAGVAALLLLRAALLRGRQVRRAPTWGCGLRAPTPRMQHTATGLSTSTLALLPGLVGRAVQGSPPPAPYPGPAAFTVATTDRVERGLLEPFVARVRALLDPFRRLQHGSLHGYLMTMLLTLAALLLWTLWA